MGTGRQREEGWEPEEGAQSSATSSTAPTRGPMAAPSPDGFEGKEAERVQTQPPSSPPTRRIPRRAPLCRAPSASPGTEDLVARSPRGCSGRQPVFLPSLAFLSACFEAFGTWITCRGPGSLCPRTACRCSVLRPWLRSLPRQLSPALPGASPRPPAHLSPSQRPYHSLQPSVDFPILTAPELSSEPLSLRLSRAFPGLPPSVQTWKPPPPAEEGWKARESRMSLAFPAGPSLCPVRAPCSDLGSPGTPGTPNSGVARLAQQRLHCAKAGWG